MEWEFFVGRQDVNVVIVVLGMILKSHHLDVSNVSVKSLNMANSQNHVCGNCAAHDDGTGQCHRHPPAIIVVSALSDARMTERPITSLDNWCLDWIKR